MHQGDPRLPWRWRVTSPLTRIVSVQGDAHDECNSNQDDEPADVLRFRRLAEGEARGRSARSDHARPHRLHRRATRRLALAKVRACEA